MRFCLLTASLALIQVAFVIGDEDLFSDELYEPFEEWAAEPSLGSGLGISLEPLLWNLDDAQLTQDSNFNLASRPMNDEPNTDNTDFWASCSPGGLGARAEPQSCPVPLRKDEAPTLPTLRDLEKAVGNTPNFHPETEPLRENTIVPLYRADSKCPPTHPHHLCCICDDAFAFEVCQDCFLCKQSSPLLQGY